MRMRLTCGICDFDTDLEDANMAQCELQWELFEKYHKHSENELGYYIQQNGRRVDVSVVDDTDDDEPEPTG